VTVLQAKNGGENTRFARVDRHRNSDSEVVGLVLLVNGSPDSREAIERYLYFEYIRPHGRARNPIDLFTRLAGSVRAGRHASRVGAQYEAIGGGRALNLLIKEQALALRRGVAARIGRQGDARVESYVVAHFGFAPVRSTLAAMGRDGVTQAILVPHFPQYSDIMTGVAFRQWHRAVTAVGDHRWTTRLLTEFATAPGYIQAVNDRVQQGLQRFPRHLRGDVHLLFVARGAPVSDVQNGDPYCCQLQQSMNGVLNLLGTANPYSLAFLRHGKRHQWMVPRVRDAVRALAAMKRPLLAVPLDLVTDQLDTAFNLDIEMRRIAGTHEIRHFQVTSGINCHPLFIAGLSDRIAELVEGDSATGPDVSWMNGVPGLHRPQIVCPRRVVGNDDSPAVCSTCCFAPTAAYEPEKKPSISAMGSTRLEEGQSRLYRS